MTVQFNNEFEMVQPGAKDFVEQWPQLAPTIVEYAERNADNVDVRLLLSELANGGQGQTAAVDYKPPPCM